MPTGLLMTPELASQRYFNQLGAVAVTLTAPELPESRTQVAPALKCG